MNSYSIIFLLINIALLFFLPKRWALLPLLIGACYIPAASVIELGSLHFTATRILISAGLVRMTLRGERLANRLNGLDWLMLTWAIWLAISSLFHEDQAEALVFRLGIVYDALGIYFLVRVFCQTLADAVLLCQTTAILLIPIALEMLYEKVTITNLYFELAGRHIGLYIRNGNVRAQGPFAHSILAGTVGAVCLPLAVVPWRLKRKEAMLGIGACLVMIITSASSGPVMSVLAGIGALFMWRHHRYVRLVLWLAIFGYIALDLIMDEPAYYIIDRIDIVGGSGGWHRARLIESASEHLSEWWLAGTDYTRHWMPSGVTWNANHTDITNHYLKIGVWGGVPLMLLFTAILAKGLTFVGKAQRIPNISPQSKFIMWALGASLFAHAATFISVSYFDQSDMFLYLTLAAIGSVQSAMMLTETGREVVI